MGMQGISNGMAMIAIKHNNNKNSIRMSSSDSTQRQQEVLVHAVFQRGGFLQKLLGDLVVQKLMRF